MTTWLPGWSGYHWWGWLGLQLLRVGECLVGRWPEWGWWRLLAVVPCCGCGWKFWWFVGRLGVLGPRESSCECG